MSTVPGFNFQGKDWALLKSFLERELLDTYKHLAKSGEPMDKTLEYRGRAAYITRLLGLDNSPASRPQD